MPPQSSHTMPITQLVTDIMSLAAMPFDGKQRQKPLRLFLDHTNLGTAIQGVEVGLSQTLWNIVLFVLAIIKNVFVMVVTMCSKEHAQESELSTVTSTNSPRPWDAGGSELCRVLVRRDLDRARWCVILY